MARYSWRYYVEAALKNLSKLLADLARKLKK